MVESALRHVRLLEDLDFRLIKISLKASDVPRTLEAYRLLAARVDYPFHAGITEAGRLLAGSVKSSAGLALLLAEGLADTVMMPVSGSPQSPSGTGAVTDGHPEDSHPFAFTALTRYEGVPVGLGESV